MKKHLFFLLFTIIQIEAFAQIPNGGFEDWEQIENYEKPLLWNTNQDTSIIRLEKDTISVEGNYSLKVVPGSYSGWLRCQSQAGTGRSFQTPIGENKSLTFFVKSLPDSAIQDDYVFIQVDVDLYIGNRYHGTSKWGTNHAIEDFKKIQIPITNPNVDSLTIIITGGAVTGATDDCSLRSTSWIDGLSIAETETTSNNTEVLKENNKLLITPNPSNGIIEIKNTAVQFNKYQLFSIEGKLIEQGEVNQSTIRFRNTLKGMFILKLVEKSNWEYREISKRIVIE